MNPRSVATFLAAVTLGAASSAGADDEPGAIRPPVAVDAGKVAAPEGAHGDATVLVEIVVGVDGRVKDATIVAGDEPFASAVLSAAGSWTFSPARRGGSPVSARIRMRVDFHAPLPAPPEPSAPQPTHAAPSPPPATGATDVLVRGKRTEVGQSQVSAGEVRQLPGAFGDAFRAIEALPGVTPIVSGLPFFFVRGAPPGNTGYFIDGVRVPLLYHLALGPSVIHPGLIDRVDFYPGGYPARFGRYAGGILDGETVAPASQPHGEANIRIFDAGALVEAPLLQDDRLTLLAAGRYSYAAAVVQLVARDTNVAYWDYQSRATYRLSPKDTISAFWFGSFDEIDTRDRLRGANGSETVGDFYPVFKTEFHRLDLRYDHDSNRGHLRLAATLGVEDSLAGSNNHDTSSVVAKSLGLRAEGEEHASESVLLRYGADVQLYAYTLDQNSQGTNQRPSDAVGSLYPDRNDVMLGAYSDVVWKASPRVEVVPGLRFDVFTSRLASGQAQAALAPGELSNATAAVGIDPRVASRVAIDRRTSWIATFGVSHQPPSLIVPVPGLTIGRLNSGLQTSLQTGQGVEVKLPLEFTATATAFLHDYLGLTDATATCLSNNGSTPDTLSNDCLAERVRGRALGLELLLKRDLTKRVTGWLSYTLSRSTRETHGLTLLNRPAPFSGLPASQTGEIPSEFDRTHVLNVIGALDLGSGWRAGARFFFYTGRPYSMSVQGIPVPPYNSERLPPFYRVDVRLEKRWRVFERGTIAFVIEGMNVTLSKEAVAISCRSAYPGGPGVYDTCTPQIIGPVSVPSIGVEGAL